MVDKSKLHVWSDCLASGELELTKRDSSAVLAALCPTSYPGIEALRNPFRTSASQVEGPVQQ